MKKTIYFLLGIAAFAACKQKDAGNGQENKNFSKLCDQYYEEGLKLFPLNATLFDPGKMPVYQNSEGLAHTTPM